VAKRFIRGDRQAFKLIKRLPDTVAGELVVQLNLTGRELVAAEKARAPVRTGALQAALSFRVSPRQLRLKVGLVGKVINRKLFYAWFVEWGRHGGGRGVKRKSAKYAAGVGATRARHIVYENGVRERVYAEFRQIWEKALRKAASGVTDD
jgi:hypothetical protein